MPRFYVSAPPDVILWESDDVDECGRVAAFNARLSGNVVLVVDERTDTVVAVGIPPTVKTHVCNDPAVRQGMTTEEAARLPFVQWMVRKSK